MMGLFGGESKSASAGSSGGAQTQVGTPTQVSVSAGDDQTARVKVVHNVTDFGAVKKAFGVVDGVIDVVESMSARDYQLQRLEIEGAERLAGRMMLSGERTSNEVLDLTRDVSMSVLDSVNEQSGQFSTAVGDLTESFQEFVGRENNPGERVNLYLIVGAASIAVLYLWGKV